MSLLRPFCLYNAVTWLSFQILGKWPSLKRLLNSLERENDIGVDIRDINLPGIPQCDKYDCFSALVIFAVSRGDVFIISKIGTFSLLSR